MAVKNNALNQIKIQIKFFEKQHTYKTPTYLHAKFKS